MAELGWEPSIDAAHVGVAANAGVVTLTGHVRSFAQKVAAERAAARVKGVRVVAEEIEVKLPYDIRRGDEDIAGAAIVRLAWDLSVPADAVEIRAEKGWITLNADDVGQNITRGLHRSWFYDPNTIKVSTQGGMIKLTGQVTTWNARELAGKTAWSAPGATSVENDISVN